VILEEMEKEEFEPSRSMVEMNLSSLPNSQGNNRRQEAVFC